MFNSAPQGRPRRRSLRIFYAPRLVRGAVRAPLTDLSVKGKPPTGGAVRASRLREQAAEVARRKARQRPRLCRAHTQYVSPPLMPFFFAGVFFCFRVRRAAVLRLFRGYTGLPIFPHIGLKQPQNVGKVFPTGEKKAVLPEIAALIFPTLCGKMCSWGKCRKPGFSKMWGNCFAACGGVFRACICPAGAPLRGIAGREKIGPERRTVPGFFFSGHKPLCDRQARTRF